MTQTHMTKLLAVFSLLVSSAAFAGQAGGLSWTVPEKEWTEEAPRPMRAATYKLPAAKGDVEAAELGVFYFGQGEGGTVEANVQRWLGQFTLPDGKPAAAKAQRKTQKIRGLEVTTVDVKGTFAGGGPMMGGGTPKPGFRLLGAIVAGPQGPVFFKLTGPEKTVASAEKSFQKLLESLNASK